MTAVVHYVLNDLERALIRAFRELETYEQYRVGDLALDLAGAGPAKSSGRKQKRKAKRPKGQQIVDLLNAQRRLLDDFGADNLLWAAERVAEQSGFKRRPENVIDFPGKPAA